MYLTGWRIDPTRQLAGPGSELGRCWSVELTRFLRGEVQSAWVRWSVIRASRVL